MKNIYTIIFSLFFILFSSLFLSSCNIKGFFVKSSDDPVWVESKPADAPKEKPAETAGGPGAEVFKRICSTCHGNDGKGMPGAFPPLAESAILDGDPTKAIKIVLHGLSGSITRNGQTFNGIMSPWQSVLSDQEIADVLTFARSSFGNKANAVTADEVKTVRDATSARTSPMTESEL